MDLNPTLVVFIVLMLLSALRAVFEFLGKIAVEAERAAKRAEDEKRQRQERQRAGMPEAAPQPPRPAPQQTAPRPPQTVTPRPQPQPLAQGPAPQPARVEVPPPEQPILLEEILRQMLGEPPAPRPAPQPAPAPAPRPAPPPAPALEEAGSSFDVGHLDTSHLEEREGRIKTRLTNEVAERVLTSGLKEDDQIALRSAQAAGRANVLAEIDRRASPLQRAIIYSELFGQPPGLTGPRHRAPTHWS